MEKLKLKKPFISFDVDSVLLNLEKYLFEFIEKEYNVKITSMDVNSWDYYAVHFPKVLDLFKEKDLYDKVEGIEGMAEVLQVLINKYGANALQIITSSHPNVIKSKEEALKRIFGHIRGFNNIKIIHVGLMNDKESSHHKHEYSKGTILIDDALHNILDHILNNKSEFGNFEDKDNLSKGLLVDFNYGWNKDESKIAKYLESQDILRVTSPKEILEQVIYLLDNNYNFKPVNEVTKISPGFSPKH